MRKLLILLALPLIMPLFESCNKCYVCTVETDHGEVHRDVCGRKRDIANLVNHLETDTTGYGPWTCE